MLDAFLKTFIIIITIKSNRTFKWEASFSCQEKKKTDSVNAYVMFNSRYGFN